MAEPKAKVPDVIVALGYAGRIVVETLLEDPKIRARVEREVGRLGKKVGKSSYAVTDVSSALGAIETIGKIVDKLHVTGDALGWFDRQRRKGQPTSGPYARLGLMPGASPELVRLAYKHLVTVHHPDRGGDAKVMAEINQAYAEIQKTWPRSPGS